MQDGNATTYGNIFVCKRELISELSRVHKILELRRSVRLREREFQLCHEVEEILKHEQHLWFQKSRSKWLNCGDRNTSYFHGCTLARWRWNNIKGLKVDNDEWFFDENSLKQHVVDYFKTLFTLEYSTNGRLNSHGKFPLLPQEDIECLLLNISNDEIRRAVFSMTPLKAPRPDGFQAKFY